MVLAAAAEAAAAAAIVNMQKVVPLTKVKLVEAAVAQGVHTLRTII